MGSLDPSVNRRSQNPLLNATEQRLGRSASAPLLRKATQLLNRRNTEPTLASQKTLLATTTKIDAGTALQKLQNIGAEAAVVSTGQELLQHRFYGTRIGQAPIDPSTLETKATALKNTEKRIKDELNSLKQAKIEGASPAQLLKINEQIAIYEVKLQVIEKQAATLERLVTSDSTQILLKICQDINTIAVSDRSATEKAELIKALFDLHKNELLQTEDNPLVEQTLFMMLGTLQKCEKEIMTGGESTLARLFSSMSDATFIARHQQARGASDTIGEIRTILRTSSQAKLATVSILSTQAQSNRAQAYMKVTANKRSTQPESLFFSRTLGSALLHPKTTMLSRSVEQTASRILSVQSDMQVRMEMLASGVYAPSKEFETVQEEVAAYKGAIQELESALQTARGDLISKSTSSIKNELIGSIALWEVQITQMKDQLTVLEELTDEKTALLAQTESQILSELNHASTHPLDAGTCADRILTAAKKQLETLDTSSASNVPASNVPARVKRTCENAEKQAKALVQLTIEEEKLQRDLLRGEKECANVDQKLLASLLSKQITTELHHLDSQQNQAQLTLLLSRLTPEQKMNFAQTNASFNHLLYEYTMRHKEAISVAQQFTHESGEKLANIHKRTSELTMSRSRLGALTSSSQSTARIQEFQNALTLINTTIQELENSSANSELIQVAINALTSDQTRLYSHITDHNSIGKLAQQILNENRSDHPALQLLKELPEQTRTEALERIDANLRTSLIQLAFKDVVSSWMEESFTTAHSKDNFAANEALNRFNQTIPEWAQKAVENDPIVSRHINVLKNIIIENTAECKITQYIHGEITSILQELFAGKVVSDTEIPLLDQAEKLLKKMLSQKTDTLSDIAQEFIKQSQIDAQKEIENAKKYINNHKRHYGELYNTLIIIHIQSKALVDMINALPIDTPKKEALIEKLGVKRITETMDAIMSNTALPEGLHQEYTQRSANPEQIQTKSLENAATTRHLFEALGENGPAAIDAQLNPDSLIAISAALNGQFAALAELQEILQTSTIPDDQSTTDPFTKARICFTGASSTNRHFASNIEMAMLPIVVQNLTRINLVLNDLLTKTTDVTTREKLNATKAGYTSALHAAQNRMEQVAPQ